MRQHGIPGGSGTIRSMRWFGDPAVHTPARHVTAFDGELDRLVADLFATMYAHRGVGLAAPQIGVPVRVFVYDCRDEEGRRRLGHLVNPRLTAVGASTVRRPEGCLSLPGVEAATPRAARVVVTGADHTGRPSLVEGAGFFARCLQHECDHLDGVVYTDRLRGLRRRRALWAVRRLPPR